MTTASLSDAGDTSCCRLKEWLSHLRRRAPEAAVTLLAALVAERSEMAVNGH